VNDRKYNTGNVLANTRTELTKELVYLYVAAI
jgi:hypothetical protein